METDKLKLYFGDDFIVNKNIKIHQPRLNDIIDMGEEEYFSVVSTLTTIPSDMKSQLWDMGIDYEKISDFELFIILSKNLPLHKTKIFFGELDFTKFETGKNKNNDELVLFQSKSKNDNGELIIIDSLAYQKITNFIRSLHNIKQKVEHAYNEDTKKILIELDRKKIKNQKNKQFKSTLFPLVSSLVNSEGFKYNIDQIRSMPIFAFMDSVSRIQVIKNVDNLLSGCYSGNVDGSKLDKKELNWMRELKD